MANIFRGPLITRIWRKRQINVHEETGTPAAIIWNPPGLAGSVLTIGMSSRWKAAAVLGPVVAVNLLVGTLAVTTEDPFKQRDWKNPQIRRAAPLTEVVPNLLGTTLAVTQDPFRQGNWPNPTIAPKARIGLGTWRPDPDAIWPNRQQDWENPLPKRPRNGEIKGLSALDLTPQLDPFHQDVWPLPQRRARSDGFTLSVTPDKGTPFVPAEIPQPIRRALPQTGDPHNLLVTTLAVTTQDPFYQLEWPNPKQARAESGFTGFHEPSSIPLQPPFSQNDWPNPLRITGPLHEAGQNTVVLIPEADRPPVASELTLPKRRLFAAVYSPATTRPDLEPIWPHRQVDWPLPVRFKPAPRTHEPGYNGTLFIPEELPNRQIDWPLPVRSKPAPLIQKIWRISPELVRPLNQHDWPLPKWRTPPRHEVGRNQTIALPEPEGLPNRQREWPLPVRAKQPYLIQKTWRPSPDSIWPYAQADWPLPQQRRFRQHEVGRNQTISLPVSEDLPNHQIDWPLPVGLRKYPLIQQTWRLPALVLAPFRQEHWPLPIRPRAGEGFVSWAEISSIPLPDPFTQSDWPLPVTVAPRPVWDHKNLFGTTLYVEPAVLPEGSQFDWPNPQLPRYTVTNYTITVNLIQTPLEAPDVEKIYSWLPIARRRRVR